MSIDLNPVATQKRASLFNIKADLEAIFDTLDENGGELTPELEMALQVKQEQLVDKLNSYVEATKRIKYEVDLCKSEKKRVDEVKKRNETRLLAINKAIKEAVIRFGQANKSGNKFIDLGLNKVTVSPSRATVIDNEHIESMIEFSLEFLATKSDNGKLDELYEDEAVLLSEMIAYLNIRMNEEFEDCGEEEFTMSDLVGIQATYSFTAPLPEILINQSIVESLFESKGTSLTNATNATYIKQLSDAGISTKFAKPSSDYTVMIK